MKPLRPVTLKPITLKLDTVLVTQFKVRCAKLNLTQRQVIERAIQQFLEEYSK